MAALGSAIYGDTLGTFFEHSANANGLEQVLKIVRRHLSMDVAFISRFQEFSRVLEYVDAEPGCKLDLKQEIPLSAGYCLKVTCGELPEFIPDTNLIPEALKIPETRELPIGSHLSTPIVFEGNKIFGTLCCFSYKPVKKLLERDMDVLRAFSEFLGFYFTQEARELKKKILKTEAIKKAMHEESPRIVFQPIYDFSRRCIHGFECLSRFDIEPLRSPDKWFEDAHEVGLGLDLELHAIENALVCMKKFPEKIKFSVNCCPELIMSGRLESLTKYGPDLSRVVLEITEHAAIDNYDILANALGSLRAKGLCLAVDDVGAGYASMRHILNLKPEIIKLDISITQSIDKDKFRRALAKGLISFASEIGSVIVAEGIESHSEFHALKILGVDFGQGYYLAKPLSLADAKKFTAHDFPVE